MELTKKDYKTFIGKDVSTPTGLKSKIKKIRQIEGYILAYLENGWFGNIIILKHEKEYLDDILKKKFKKEGLLDVKECNN